MTFVVYDCDDSRLLHTTYNRTRRSVSALFIAGDPASQSTPIKWKEGRDLVSRAESLQAANGMKSVLTRSPARTFFQWFLGNTDPSADDIAEVIKDDMWPNPLQYFLAPDMEMDENGLARLAAAVRRVCAHLGLTAGREASGTFVCVRISD